MTLKKGSSRGPLSIKAYQAGEDVVKYSQYSSIWSQKLLMMEMFTLGIEQVIPSHPPPRKSLHLSQLPHHVVLINLLLMLWKHFCSIPFSPIAI